MARKERNTKNVLVIGDIHEPFCLKGYREFVLDVYHYHQCTHVIFIGDTIDNHSVSFYDPDPDLHSPADELQRARRKLERWHDLFPNADVCIGNHEKRVFKAATKNRLSRAWVKDYADVLNTPSWVFSDELIYDNVRYIHGEGMNAERRALMTGMNTVCGDKHTQMFIKHIPQHGKNLWSMQVGCGLDRESKAAAYAVHHAPQIIGCGVVLNHGTMPILIPKP